MSTELFETELFICIKMDLTLNNLEWLMCHKTRPNQTVMTPLSLFNSWDKIGSELQPDNLIGYGKHLSFTFIPLDESKVLQYFVNVRYDSVDPDAFAEVVKVANNHTGR